MILIIGLNKLVESGQHKLHMKPTTSLHSVIQQCQIFVYVLYCNLKEKDIRRIINGKEKKN